MAKTTLKFEQADLDSAVQAYDAKLADLANIRRELNTRRTHVADYEKREAEAAAAADQARAAMFDVLGYDPNAPADPAPTPAPAPVATE